LIYLGLLPSLATFALLSRYGYPHPFLVFVIGIALMGVYLTFTYHFTPLPQSTAGTLLGWLDGPIVVLAAQRLQGSLQNFAIESFMIDGLNLWLAILGLAVLSSKPTRGQRIASLGIGVVVVGGLISLLWPYATETLWSDKLQIAWLGIGVAEGAVMHYQLLKNEKVRHAKEDQGILYVALLILVWIGALNAGIIVHNMR
jgi:hypothetical protein